MLEAIAEPEVRKALIHVQVNPVPQGAEGTTAIVRKMHGIAQSVFGSGAVALNDKNGKTTGGKAAN
ncbi:hypothetical protein SDC9_135924 [bioreactor metagenome]|uniref:Uncharacterized protein n=1 Tax=bioreactor metagenome TaxID=1076179 RepID=A0A645DH60_9ZZZZ